MWMLPLYLHINQKYDDDDDDDDDDGCDHKTLQIHSPFPGTATGKKR